MSWLDYSFIGVVVFSALLGGWRGLAYEVISLMGWIAAYVVARLFSDQLLPFVPIEAGADSLRFAMAFGILFIGTLMATALLAAGMSRLIKSVGLGWLNGLLGSMFGVVRGGLIVLSLTLAVGMTDFSRNSSWRDAKLTPYLQTAAVSVSGLLPENMAARLNY
jgi:membrane protein required for colicin V production